LLDRESIINVTALRGGNLISLTINHPKLR
jgi:hypothetical protein